MNDIKELRCDMKTNGSVNIFHYLELNTELFTKDMNAGIFMKIIWGQ